MKKISIIIACHNCADTVPDTWASLKGQSIGVEHLECIFVDDASDDGGKTWQSLVAIEAQAFPMPAEHICSSWTRTIPYQQMPAASCMIQPKAAMRISFSLTIYSGWGIRKR